MLRAGLLQTEEALDVVPRRGLGWRLAHGGDGRRRLEVTTSGGWREERWEEAAAAGERVAAAEKNDDLALYHIENPSPTLG
jgi:hypothetical protein